MRYHLANGRESPDVAAVISEVDSGAGLSDLQRALANSPEALRAYLGMSRHVREHSGLPGRLRELVILRIQQYLQGEYEWRRHVRSGLAGGLTEADIRELVVWETSSRFDDYERMALRLVDAILGAEDIERAMAEVRSAFSNAGGVDLCLLIGFYLLGGALILSFDLASGDRLAPAGIPLPPPPKKK